MGLRDLERAIERRVDGVLGRVFRSDVNELELSTRLRRELEAGVRRQERGGEVVRIMPNAVEIDLHPDDLAALDDETATLQKELVALAREHARDAGCGFAGPLVVRLAGSESTRRGTVDVTATTRRTIDGMPPGTLVYPNGYRLDLTAWGSAGVLLGRDPTSDIEIDDDNASRRHARVRPTDQGWLVEDLDSTNGTRVNQFRTAAQLLADGDQVTIGGTTFRFDAS